MYFLDLIERFHKCLNENLMLKSDLNIRTIPNISNISIGKPREENYIANTNHYNNDGNQIRSSNLIPTADDKAIDSSSFEGNNSSNFIVMTDTERITAPGVFVNEKKEYLCYE